MMTNKECTRAPSNRTGRRLRWAGDPSCRNSRSCSRSQTERASPPRHKKGSERPSTLWAESSQMRSKSEHSHSPRRCGSAGNAFRWGRDQSTASSRNTTHQHNHLPLRDKTGTQRVLALAALHASRLPLAPTPAAALPCHSYRPPPILTCPFNAKQEFHRIPHRSRAVRRPSLKSTAGPSLPFRACAAQMQPTPSHCRRYAYAPNYRDPDFGFPSRLRQIIAPSSLHCIRCTE